jgi:hypothetical protein
LATGRLSGESKEGKKVKKERRKEKKLENFSEGEA